MTAAEKTNIVIRADGNPRIGVGHLMRCLTVADEIRDKDRICFWCADEASAALAADRGYKVRVLGTDYRDMLSELPQWEEMGAQEDAAAAKLRRTILVDSYYVNPQYLQALQNCGRVYLMDDLAKQAWPVDGVINYNAYAEEKQYEQLYAKQQKTDAKKMPELYIGPAYIPLRPQFTGRDFEVRRQVKEMLVTTGGGDQENIAGRILERIGDVGCRIHVVSGPFNPHGRLLAEYAAAHSEVVVHQQVKEMAELMRQCDLAVTAGGTTVYELCAIGVPFICFSYAENQEALTDYVGRQEIGRNAGRYHRDPAKVLEQIAQDVRQAMTDGRMRQEMSQKARAVVDGGGAGRLARALENAPEAGQL